MSLAREEAIKSQEIVAAMRPLLWPLLQGHSPEVQSAALADLVATWLAGFVAADDPNAVRKELLNNFIKTVWELVPPNEAMLLSWLREGKLKDKSH
jgi:hypothetical protein